MAMLGFGNQEIADNPLEVSGILTGAVIRYLRNLGGDATVKLLLTKLGLPTEFVKNLEDPTNWISSQEASKLLTTASSITADPKVGRSIGTYHMRLHEESGIADLLASLGSPKEVLQNISKVAPKYTTFTEMQALEVGDAHAVIRVRTRDHHERDIQMCYFTHGILSQAPVLFGLVPAVVTESECQARGGRFCLYSVAWEQHQWSSFVDEGTSLFSVAWEEDKISEIEDKLELSPEEELEQLRVQVDSLTKRLEEVFVTAADLLSFSDAEAILTKITQRAGRSVNAPMYLLTVRTSTEENYKIQYHGFDPTEAQDLAHQIESGNLDDLEGSRLIVEVKSSRFNYGWLIAANAPGMKFFDQDRNTLELYANYAATALDVATALDEARRSDQTARALLKLGSAISTTRTQKEVATVLANTTPDVLGAITAGVFLWNEQERSFIEVARAVPKEIENLVPVDLQRIHPGSFLSSERLLSASEPIILNAADDEATRQTLAPWHIQSALFSLIGKTGDQIGIIIAGFNSVAEITKDVRERMAGLSDQAYTGFVNAKLVEQISHMAWHDALTGLPNRRLFEDRVKQEINRSERTNESFTLFYVDLDRFKHINDTMGHQAGDDLICQVAERLTECVRTQDTVARLGGDEFAVLLPGLSDEAVIQRLAQRILDALNKPFIIQGTEVKTSGSIGISCTKDQTGLTYDQILHQADEAMYESKSFGRNMFTTFSAESSFSTDDRTKLAEEIPRAIKEGQLELLYQPQISLEHLELIGLEALVRWNHPVLGTLLPASFVPAAEVKGIINQLDEWVLNTACEQLRIWDSKSQMKLNLSVNFTVSDMLSAGLVETVKSVLDKYEIEYSRLQIDLSEHSMARHDERLAAVINELRTLGIRIAIDDAGSSLKDLSSVKDYNVDTIKVDISVVKDYGARSDEGIKRMNELCEMAADMGAELSAEGVETQKEGEEISKSGIATAQGFFYGPPLKKSEIERLILQSAKNKIST
jgi:diguanylate cyclase (GGDEF)-like protein